MSVANLSNPINQLTDTIYCKDLTCTNLNASFATLPVIQTTNLVAEGIQIQPIPPINNTLDNLLVLDPFGDIVVRQATSIPGSGNITGASSLGTGQAIYQGQTGSILEFNSLTGTAGNIIVSPPISGNINLNIGSNIVNLTGSQVLTNKTLTNPVISTISNSGILTLPTTTGTLALTSQIPSVTNTSTVNDIASFSNTTGTIQDSGILSTNIPLLNANNIFTGTNNRFRFAITTTGTTLGSSTLYAGGTSNGSLQFTDGTNTQIIAPNTSVSTTINLPTISGTFALTSQIPTNSTYVDLATTQTITGAKTFSTAPSFSSITNTGTITLPTSTDTLVGRATTDTLTNKTIDSASNTLSVNSTNINSLINQDVRTTASPQYGSIGIGTAAINSGTLTFTDGTTSRLIALWSGGSTNQHQFIGMGVNVSTFRFQVNNTATDFVYYAGTSSSASNEVFRIGGSSMITTYGGKKTYNYVATTTTNTATPVTVLTIAVPTNSALTISSTINAFCSAGTDANKAKTFLLISSVRNISGTVTVTTVSTSSGGDNIATTLISHVASGTNVLVQITGSSVDTISWSGESLVYY